jgi:hypothetical protein
MNNFILIFTLAIFSVYGLFGADNKKIDPSKPSEYLTNVGLMGVATINEDAIEKTFIPMSFTWATSENKKFVLSMKYQGAKSKFNPDYPDDNTKSSSNTYGIMYHHQYYKNYNNTFCSFEINSGLKIITGDYSPFDFGITLGLMAGLKITDNFLIYPLAQYIASIGIIDDFGIRSQIDLGAQIPIIINDNFYIKVIPMFTSYTEGFEKSGSENSSSFYSQEHHINYLISNSLIIGGVYIAKNDFKYGYIGAEASYYFGN